MADQRITQLAQLLEGDVGATDLLPIVDVSASETKKVTAKDLFEAGAALADPGSVPLAKVDFSAGVPSGDVAFAAGDVVLGRLSTGAGKGQEIACTAAGRSVIGAATAADQRAAIGLGTLAVRSGSWVDGSSFAGTSSGINTGDQTITLTGPVTGTGKGTFATSLAVGGVTTAALADGGVTTDKLAK